jgi:lipopolysaccharide export system permease protein
LTYAEGAGIIQGPGLPGTGDPPEDNAPRYADGGACEDRTVMKILYRYILRELFYTFAVLLFLFAVIFVAYKTYDTRDEILEDNPPIVDVVKYILMVVPGEMVDVLPLVAMFSVLFSMGMLAKNKEVLAMIAMGVNFNRLGIPVAMFGAVIGLGAFVMAADVAPAAKNYGRFLFEVKIKGGNLYAFTGNDEIFRKGEGQRFYIMANFDSATNVMTAPTIFEKDDAGKGLKVRMEAQRARFIESTEEGEIWEFEGLRRWTFKSDGTFGFEQFSQPTRLALEEKLASFLSREKRPDEMTATELRDYAMVLKRQGGGPRMPVYLTAFHAIFTVPATIVLLALVGYATAVDLKTRNFVWAFSIGLAFGLSFYFLRTALHGMGGRDLLPALWAAWAPCALLGCLTIVLLRRLQQVH